MKRTERTVRGKKLLLIVSAAVVAAAILILAGCSSNTAATMRLIRAEGEVKVENDSGKSEDAAVNARLSSGERLRTGAGSVAAVSMDDTKVASLDELSCAEFVKSGRALEFRLIEGGAFFDVMEKLRDDESFDVKTATMVVGIRGTSGYVKADDKGGEFWLTDGEVEVTVEIGGVKKTVTVHSGERLTVSQTESGEPELVVEEYEPEDLPAFVRESIEATDADPGLVERVLQANGWEASVFDVPETDGGDTEPVTEPEETEPEATEPEETEPEETEPEVTEPEETEPATEAPTDAPETEPATEAPTDAPGTEPEKEEPKDEGHVHDGTTFIEHKRIAPTCTADGRAAYWECRECGALFLDANGRTPATTLKIPATGHRWDGGKVTTEPTCEKSGVKTYTCLNDASHTRTETVTAVGHRWDGGKVTTEPTCEKAGVRTITCLNDKTHVRTEEIPATGHKPGEAAIENAVEPTCEETGSRDEVVYCSVCGKELSRTGVEIPAVGHKPGEAAIENEVEPTCEEAGSYDEVVYCSVCGEEISRTAKETPAAGHKLEFVAAVFEDCENDGAESHWRCTVCGKLFEDENGEEELTEDDIRMPAWGHDVSYIPPEEPTCVMMGNIGFYYCFRCFTAASDPEMQNTLTADEFMIPALGHEWGIIDPGNGYVPYFGCIRCGTPFITGWNTVIPAGAGRIAASLPIRNKEMTV